MLIKGANAVITGSNRGIGRALVSVFAENGANIWACVRKPSDGFSDFIQTIEAAHGVTVTPVYFDLANEDEVKQGLKDIRGSKAPIDILVNNAGMIFTALTQMTSVAKMRELFEVNFFAQARICQEIGKIMMRNKQGAIINLSSSAAIEGNEGRSAYAASKAAINTFTKVMAKEWAPYNIRVNAIAPGLTETEMMTSSTPDDALAYTLQRIDLRRVGQPTEIANVALFLASSLSSYMTGQVVRVDGGM